MYGWGRQDTGLDETDGTSTTHDLLRTVWLEMTFEGESEGVLIA